jgi:hypothetical protein
MVNISSWFMLIINMLGGSIHTLKKNAEALVVASKENGLK